MQTERAVVAANMYKNFCTDSTSVNRELRTRAAPLDLDAVLNAASFHLFANHLLDAKGNTFHLLPLSAVRATMTPV
jgi:hypothetical protein